MKLRLTLLALVSAFGLRAASGTPVFNAMLTVGKEHRFVLVDGSGKTSGFLALGETFASYKLAGYDVKTGELSLDRDGSVTKLTIVADAATVNAPAKTPATIADAAALMKAMNFEQMMDRTMLAVRKQQAAAMGQMTGRMVPANADPETREAIAAFQKKVVDEMMSGVKGADIKDEVAKIYSEVFTKEQLDGLAAFYQSPTGVAFSDKQPEIAEKMNGIVMSRIMEAMPRVQQMSQDFRKEMAAKRGGAGAPSAPGATPTPAPAGTGPLPKK